MTRHPIATCRAFTLIEMIGVLAVIAVLGSLLVPKIFEAIHSARIDEAALSCHGLKTAVLDHYGKFFTLASSNGIPLSVPDSYDNFDMVLVAEGLMDKPLNVKIASGTLVRLRNVAGYTPDTDVNFNSNFSSYDLDGDGKNDIVGAHYLVEAILSGVSEADAAALNDRVDGPQLGEMGQSGQDFRGRVTYQKANGSNPFLVHIYITHF